MKLHQQRIQRNVVRAVAPMLSRAICLLGATGLIRKVIATLNYLLGRGAGMGWALDSEVEVALRCIKRDNPIVMDVGANVGDWSQKYRELQPAGTLYMFEPQAACHKAIGEKSIPNAELVEVAVGKENGKLRLYSSSPTDGTASLHERRDSFFEDRTYEDYEVDVISLDRFVDEHEIDFVDYIKFDIEGHELEALYGLRETLSSGKVGAFSFEFGGPNLNSRTCFRDFWHLLSPDYELSIITPSGKLEAIDEYYEDMEFYRGVSNFVAQLRRRDEGDRVRESSRLSAS